MIDLSEVAPAFTFVLTKGLRPSTSEYSPETFGNAFVELEGRSFWLRFVRDRGQLFADIGARPGAWRQLEDAIQFVDEDLRKESIASLPAPSTLARQQEQHWDALEALFADPRKTAEFVAFADRKARAFMDRLIGPR